MKFSNIVTAIQAGDYEINVPLYHIENMLEEYTKNYDLQLTPDFQRGHGAIRS